MLKKAADIVAVSCAMIGATLVSLNLGINHIGYMFFIVSGIATLYLIKVDNVRTSFKIITLYYIFINIIGLIRY